MHNEPDVLVANRRLTCIDPDAQPHAPSERPFGSGKRPLNGYCCANALSRAVKNREERVALGADLTPVVVDECLTDDTPMMLEKRAIVLTRLAQKTSRTLDIGKQKGGGPDWACESQRVSRPSLRHRHLRERYDSRVRRRSS